MIIKYTYSSFHRNEMCFEKQIFINKMKMCIHKKKLNHKIYVHKKIGLHDKSVSEISSDILSQL